MKNLISSLFSVLNLFRNNNQTFGALMAKGASGSFALSLGNTGMVFLTSILLARSLGVESFGSYAYIISWLTLAGVASKMGLDLIVPRFVAKYLHENDLERLAGFFQFSLAMIILSSIASMAISDGISWLLSDSSPVRYIAVWIAMILLPINALNTPFTGFLVGMQKVVRAQLPVLFVTPIGFLFLIAAAQWYLHAGLSLIGVFTLQIIASSIGLVYAVILFRQTALPITRGTKPCYEGYLWFKSAIPVALMGGMYVINTNTDILMLGSMRGVESAGIYKIATRGADLIMLVATMIGVALAPIISTLHTEKNMLRLQRGITKTTRIGFALTLPICLGLVLFGRSFLLLFGDGFVQAYAALVILSVMQLAAAAAGPTRLILVMTGNERIATIGLLVGTVLNIFLNFMLIPSFGINGAALATMLSTLLSHFILILFVWKSLKINSTIFSNRLA